eukprot:10088-Heterococcus_DN1.PRE.1
MDINPLMNYAAAVVHPLCARMHAARNFQFDRCARSFCSWFYYVACKEEGHEEQLCATVVSCVMCTSEVLLKKCVHLLVTGFWFSKHTTASKNAQAATFELKNLQLRDTAVSDGYFVPVKSSSECIARPGAPLQSRSGDAALVVSKQGVLTLTGLANDHDETTVLWSSSTAGSHNVVTEAAAAAADARAGLFMQPDGQLLLAEPDGSTVYWQQSHAVAPAGAYIQINNDNSFGVYYAHGDTAVVDCLWTSASELSSGLHVTAPHSFYTASRAYELRLQVDGNLAVYDTATKYIVWQTGTTSAVLPVLYMTVEGNLVLTTAATLHDSSIEPLWQLCAHSVGAYMHIDDITGTVGLYAAHKPAAAVSTKVAVPLVTTADSYKNDSYNSGSYNNRVIAARSLLTLTQDTQTYKSTPSGVYTLDFQVDYHLILYIPPNNVTWQTYIFDRAVNTLNPATFKYEVKLLLNLYSSAADGIVCVHRFTGVHAHHHRTSRTDDSSFFITLVYSFTLQNKSGNLFITADDGTGAVTKWQTGVITPHADPIFDVDDEGFFGLYAKDSSIPYWTSSASIQRYKPIASGTDVSSRTDVYSPNRAYALALQGDDNLCIYIVTAVERKTADAIWCSKYDSDHVKERSSTSTGPYSLIMQWLDSDNAVIWHMDTGTDMPSYANMQDDGRLCVYIAATAELVNCVGKAVPTDPPTPVPTATPTRAPVVAKTKTPAATPTLERKTRTTCTNNTSVHEFIKLHSCSEHHGFFYLLLRCSAMVSKAIVVCLTRGFLCFVDAATACSTAPQQHQSHHFMHRQQHQHLLWPRRRHLHFHTLAPSTVQPKTAQPTVAATTTSTPTTAVPTAVPTAAPVVVTTPTPISEASLYTVNMTTILAKHSGTFNETAFSQAVVNVLANSSDATGIAVNITSFSSAVARRLQSTTAAATSDVTVNYQIQHINGENTASDIQKQLESSSSSTALVDSYKTLSAIKTVSSATTTTTGIPISETRNSPVIQKKTSPATPITGIIAGVVVGVIAALLMLTVWCKRDTLRAKYSNRQQRSNIQLPRSLPDQESGLLNSANSFINNNSSSSNNIGMSVFNSSGGNNSNSVESFSFPVRRKPSASTQVLHETQSPRQQQLTSQNSTGMIADSALADTTDIDDITTPIVDDSAGDTLRGISKQYKQAAVNRSNAVTTDSTATTVAGTSIAAASTSSTSTELVTVDSQSSNRKANALRHVTTAAKAYTDANATIDAVAADTTAITAAGTAIVKKSKLTSKASKLAQGFTSSITSVVKKGVKDHGSKIEVAVEAFGAVAEHIPYVCHAWGLCNEVILLFSANAEISSNCAEVVSWAQQMQGTLDALEKTYGSHPKLQMESNLALMNKAEAVITELLVLARRHNKNNMLLQFALSRKTQSLIDDAGNKFNEAISKLQLGLAVTQLGVNLRIDENVTLLL